jgi:two-component system C4-dicarboxylate transport response regulator DctD
VRILVVDDNRSSAEALGRMLAKRGDDVTWLYDGGAAISHLTNHPTDLVITDLGMHPVHGLDVLRSARALRPPAEVIVFTGEGNIPKAVEAVRLGARDFLTKPVSIEQLHARVDEIRAPAAKDAEDREAPLTAESPASKAMLATLEKLAKVPSRVWIEGETGSGRGHAAWTLHRLAHAGEPFVVVDPSRPFVWPARGTVVLSGIDTLPDDAQVDLARRLGSPRPDDAPSDPAGRAGLLPPGVRVIATARPSTRDLHDHGLFRPELFFRLAVFIVRVPALHERREDIVPMFRHALLRFATRYRRTLPTLTADEVQRLEAHPWPGNVRELLNTAERYVVLGELTIPNTPTVARERPVAPTSPIGPGFSIMDHLDAVEHRILLDAIDLTGGSVNAMCAALTLQPNTLRYKLRKFNLWPPVKPTRERLEAGLRATGGVKSDLIAWSGLDETSLRYWLERYDLRGALRDEPGSS